MGIAKRDEGKKVNSEINVTPMVDVMLVLLIIFMVVTPFLHPGTDVQMAKTDRPVLMQLADTEDAVLIAVTRDGKVWFGNNQLPLDQVTAQVKDRLDKRQDKRVFVRADAHAKYGSVVDVVDNVRSAGVSDLGLLTEPGKLSPPPPSDPNRNKTPTT